MSFRRFLWPEPDYAAEQIGSLGRLGRVLHWLAAGIAGVLIIVAAGNVASFHLVGASEGWRWALYNVLGALIALLIGRALRFIMAAE